MRGHNRALTKSERSKPFRNWKLTGHAFYDRTRNTQVRQEAVPAIQLDADEVNRRIKYGY